MGVVCANIRFDEKIQIFLMPGTRRECCPFPVTKKVVKNRLNRLNVPVLPQPVSLRLEIPVNNIAFLILETPGDDKHGIAFAYPGPLLNLTLDPAHAGDTVNALDTDMVCSHHCFGPGKLLVVPFLGQPHTGNGRAIGIDRIRVYRFIVFFLKTSHSTNYVRTTSGG